MRSSLVAALAAASLVIAPTASLAASSGGADALSLAQATPSAADLQRPNDAVGSGLIIAGVVVVAVIVLFFVLLDDDDDDPISA